MSAATGDLVERLKLGAPHCAHVEVWPRPLAPGEVAVA